ncbi:MAG: hypothetical protein C4570_05535 [Ammonifex sp.]|nr:MAG: hypothetical protein C4570_05535 [Ammonifex sp.]
MNPKEQFKAKLDRIVKRLLEQRVIPFLGTGVSKGSPHYDDQNPEFRGLADTTEMMRRIADSIDKEMEGQESWRVWCCKNNECTNRDGEMGKKCELANASLNQLCETYIWHKRGNPNPLVDEVLKIKEFANLRPRSAHRYIAFLAREEFIDEVITTNYDTCIERAYKETFEGPDETKNGLACVVVNIEDYREKAGQVYVTSSSKKEKTFDIRGQALLCEFISGLTRPQLRSQHQVKCILYLCGINRSAWLRFGCKEISH